MYNVERFKKIDCTCHGTRPVGTARLLLSVCSDNEYILWLILYDKLLVNFVFVDLIVS